MNKGFLCAVILVLSISLHAFSQNISNEGTDFWAVFPSHVPTGGSLANLEVFVTSKFDTEVTITCGNYNSGLVTIPANTSVGITVDRSAAYININDANSKLINKGIHVVVSSGKPKVAAYAHIYAGYRSAASLILPFETLGQKYFSVNYRQNEWSRLDEQGYNYLTVVAVENNTKLKLKDKSGREIDLPELNAGDVYEYTAGLSDLTGVSVYVDPQSSSCKRFAAFSGSSNILIADCIGGNSSDPLYQQVYPTSSLGKTYGIVPFKDQAYFYRAVAVEDNTRIYQDGELISTLAKAGDFYTSSRSINGTFVSADKNILLSQYMYSAGCANQSGGRAPLGDADMVLLNSVEFNVNNITIFSSPKQEIPTRFLNVLIKTNKTSSFKINGVVPSVTWNVLPGNAAYSYAQISLLSESATLSASEGFNAIAYGFGTTESYAYSAGTNLSSNNYLTVVNDVRRDESPNGCVGQNVDFKVNLPYQPDKITWTLEGGTPEVIDQPVPEVRTINGQTTYVYSYPVNKVYTEVNEYHLQVLAHVPANATNCTSGDLITNYVFNIYDLPVANFTAPISSCANSEVAFSDQSDARTADFSITEWQWDFKDGSISREKNPQHRFAQAGRYNVTLVVKSGTGCYSDPVEKVIDVYPLPEADFTAPIETCINTNFTVQDLSTINNTISTNTLTNWNWDFGDGTAPSNDQHPTHQYTSTGLYTIKLTTTSNRGCISAEKTAIIKVTDLPQADFTMPDICLTDAVAMFTSTAVNTSGNSNGLTYSWNFGDRYLSAVNLNTNTSTDQNGVHTYTVPGQYQVTLTITNANGCVNVKTQNFVVNGAVPRADFDVLSNGLLCSNNTVTIKNKSTVDFGRITKIEVYKDVEHNPSNFETFRFPVQGQQIDLNYTAFSSPATQDYQIKVVAYSGGRCFDFLSKTITLKAVPILTVDEFTSVCENDGNVTFNQFHEVSGIAGDGGVYSSDGRGLSANGTFNPKLAGIGSHNVTYTFTADNGCTASITKSIIVYASPRADAGSTVFILSGGEVQLPAVANGENLTYEWTPAKALSNNKVLNPVASPEEDTEYTLTVTANPSGCQNTAKVLVKVLQVLSPPNTFTPNGDNVNDVWNINYLESYPKATVEVFNRNGNRVFFSNGYRIPFDGNFQNEPLPVGVYYYIINPRNGRKSVTGPLTIIR